MPFQFFGTDKRSDSQSTTISDNILPSNTCTKSRFHSKSKEVRFDTNSEFYVYRHGISGTTKFSQGPSRLNQGPNSDYQNSSFLQSSIGKLSAAAGFVLLGRLHLRPLQMCLLSVWRPHILPLDHQVMNSSMIRFYLNWWMDNNRFALGTSIHPPDPNVFLFTDASHYGWGAHLEPMRLSFHGHWSEDQSQLHINMLEMMANRFTLRKAIRFIHHTCIIISTNNTTVVSYINKQGGTHSPNLCIEVWEILHWCLQHDVVIRVHHFPGKFNILADCLSKLDRPIEQNGPWINIFPPNL